MTKKTKAQSELSEHKAEQPPRRRRMSASGRHRLALGTIAATGLLLSACEEAPQRDQMFTSVERCTNAGFSQLVCQREYEEARKKHETNAPKFKTEAECETKFGSTRCYEQKSYTPTGSSSSFSPFLTGFMVAHALRNVTSRSSYYSYRSNYPNYYSAPIYRERGGRMVTTVAKGGRPSATRPVNVNTRTVSRRGFGGRSFSRGWGG